MSNLRSTVRAFANPIVIERACDACRIRTVDVVPIVGDSPDLTPVFVCADWSGCCDRYRHGETAESFARKALR